MSLLRTLLGNRAESELTALADACAGLPLALRIVAARSAGRPDLPIAPVGEAFDGPDPATNLRAVFSWSYEALSPGAARLFRLLGVYPAADITEAAAASLAGLSISDTRALLRELARAHLFVEQTPGRYGTHDLLRAYAAELTDDEAGPATERLLDHYLHSGLTAAGHLDLVRARIPVAPAASGVTPEDPGDHDGALAWYTAERRVLLAMVDLAAATGRPAHTWALAWTLTDFLDRQGHWHDLLSVQRLALAATQVLDDRRAQARTHNGLAHAYTRLDRYHEADVLTSLRETHRDAGQPEEAAEAWRTAIALFTELDVPDADRVRALLAGQARRAPGKPQAPDDGEWNYCLFISSAKVSLSVWSRPDAAFAPSPMTW